jgi:hypothetical protein
LEFLRDATDDRRYWLFAAACFRNVWGSLGESDRRAVEKMEREVDGKSPSVAGEPRERAPHTAEAVAQYCQHGYSPSPSQEGLRQATLIRDIFGNPFRPVAFSPSWRTDTALSLAQQMYESRDFGAMPILADALQDAGCDNEDVLSHCRAGKATHVRGCWVVDLVLDKA